MSLEAIVLCAVTLHLIAQELEKLVQLSILHVGDATARELRAQNIHRAVLLGTKFTMESSFFKDKLSQYGIEVMLADADERQPCKSRKA